LTARQYPKIRILVGGTVYITTQFFKKVNIVRVFGSAKGFSPKRDGLIDWAGPLNKINYLIKEVIVNEGKSFPLKVVQKIANKYSTMVYIARSWGD